MGSPSEGVRPARILRLLLGVVAITAGTSCGTAEQVSPWRPPDVLLISLDTLRADYLMTYGYARETTPRLAQLAQQSIVFDRAYAPAPHTLPSHASLFTGLYPATHGLVARGTVLSAEIPTLAELLSRQGYQTAGFVNAYFLAPEFGFSRGFGHYDFAHDIDDFRDAEATNAAILSWIDDSREEPLFLFAHYFDPHSDWDHLPYDAPEPFSKRFVGDPPETFRAGNGKVWASRYLALLNRENLPVSAEALRHTSDLYDAGVAYTDDSVGALLDALESRGRLERTIIIVTSDHGEEFREHGKLLHTQVYEELMRVPLLVSLPEMRGHAAGSCRDRRESTGRPGRVHGLVQHVDFLPMLAECLGFPVPENVLGPSFLGALFGEATKREAVYFDTVDGSQQGILREDGWKLVESLRRGERRLYHLGEDPGEQRDRSNDHPELMTALASQLEAHVADAAASRIAADRIAVPEEVHQALEALGYVRDEPKE
jgi:arylsulfatase